MNFEKYDPIDKSGICIIRTFMKLFNKDFVIVEKELNTLAEKMHFKSCNEIEVFERYLEDHGFSKSHGNGLVRELNLPKGKYAVFCYRDDFYHMFAVIDDVIYDKNEDCMDLFVISIYKRKED